MHTTPPTAPSSNNSLEGLVVALRAELKEYGGLLCLLHEEQDLILTDPNRSDAIGGLIGRQAEIAREAVDARLQCMRLFGGDDATDLKIVSVGPVAMRPLLNALFVEVASVAARVQVFSDQNAWLRKRAAQIAGLRARRSQSAG